jgi:hypothetical protein
VPNVVSAELLATPEASRQLPIARPEMRLAAMRFVFLDLEMQDQLLAEVVTPALAAHAPSVDWPSVVRSWHAPVSGAHPAGRRHHKVSLPDYPEWAISWTEEAKTRQLDIVTRPRAPGETPAD